jgi:hypothetical protein
VEQELPAAHWIKKQLFTFTLIYLHIKNSTNYPYAYQINHSMDNILLHTLTVPQHVKKSSTFYVCHESLTVPGTACHQNLSRSQWFQFTPNSFQIHCNIILPSRVLGLSTLNIVSISHLSCVCYVSSPSHHLQLAFIIPEILATSPLLQHCTAPEQEHYHHSITIRPKIRNIYSFCKTLQSM